MMTFLQGSSPVLGSRGSVPIVSAIFPNVLRSSPTGYSGALRRQQYTHMHFFLGLALRPAMDEFLKEYSNELRTKLQRNDKTTINMLSMLAEAQKDRAEGIVGVIEKHILTVHAMATRNLSAC
eukprot:GHUV01033424.1.p1 GENE.GHUV01033424.1~~GHUV01033424.1.p1  ORF type:complete len:123 (-),score=2.88 GHUV01033424.1:144-512(-)